MASTNSNPTLEDVRNIEKSWNSGLQADYDAVAAKYPEHNLADIKPQVRDWLPNRSDVHPVTGEAIILGFNMKTRSNIEVTPEIINCLKKYSLKVDEGDDCVFHTFDLRYDNDQMVTGAVYHSNDLEDKTEPDPDDPSKTIVSKGVKTYLAEGKVSILTRDDGVQELHIDNS